ncbi:CHAT domain-containing protein [Hygrophoropsis aurantiaca]|uniref:CHAT domain-containing protein n=1 Tax=Hygrophoropsis aurantiaca TaxID=72124 RepID=A0ACB7ZZ95_9AGAM|nr:CHAT domain-containing protein [Hygrophoropsis aurantiaca]
MRPEDHPSRFTSLSDLGLALVTRFQQLGDPKDLEDAIESHRIALKLMPLDDLGRATLLSNLASSLLYQTSLSLLPAGHTERPRTLSGLGIALEIRFEELHIADDLDLAIKYHQDALALRPPGNLHRPILATRFDNLGDEDDLKQAIEYYRAAVDLYPPEHYHRCVVLENLAHFLQSRSIEEENSYYLDEAIELHRNALALRPSGHPRHSISLDNLAWTLHDRYNQTGNIDDLNSAIENYRKAFSINTPASHSDPPISPYNLAHSKENLYRSTSALCNLASTLQIRYHHRGNIDDLTQAIEYYRTAVQLRPAGHGIHYAAVGGYALVLHARFTQGGHMDDLEKSIELSREALGLQPLGSADRPMALNNLACRFFIRFTHRGDKEDLDQAIQHYRAFYNLLPERHADRPYALNHLANALHARFQQQRDPTDLDDAIKLFRASVELYPTSHPERVNPSSNLAQALHSQFEERGNSDDLDEAISIYRSVLELLPAAHTHRAIAYDNLGSVLQTRFEQRGDIDDLDQAVESHRAALDLQPPSTSTSSRPTTLSNLARALQTRFEKRGEVDDLDKAIEDYHAALDSFAAGHFQRPELLDNLANALHTRFLERGSTKDLCQAVQYAREVLEMRPVGHMYRSKSLTNLALILHSQFKQSKKIADLDQGIEYNRAALELCPHGHRDHAASLTNLASLLLTRYKFTPIEKLDDFTECLRHLRAAEHTCGPNHPLLAHIYDHISSAYYTKYATSHQISDLDEVFRYYALAASHRAAGTRLQLREAAKWVHDAEELSHSSALDAYKSSLSLMDRQVTASPTDASRYHSVKGRYSTLAADAGSCALRLGLTRTAIELLEQGRALVWTHMARFRTPLDDLRRSDGDGRNLADEFASLSTQLDRTPNISGDTEAVRYRQLTEQWDVVVEKIRGIHGFSRFLLPPLFRDLQDAAQEGPVIVVNGSQYSCDAVIVMRNTETIRVPLVDLTLPEVSRLSAEFSYIIKSTSAPGEEKLREQRIIAVLRQLWELIVEPVVNEIQKTRIPLGSRIWWCPTSKFATLPLHAAGPYRRGGRNLPQMYISSYTPTLSALIRARRKKPLTPISNKCSFVAIGQAQPKGTAERELQSVDAEIALIQSIVSPCMPFTRLADEAATDSAALHALSQHSWVHLSCHGTQDAHQPFASRFAMRDAPLYLSSIIRVDLASPEFAFLSACHTAVGDESTPDEVIHLAAGMQFAGFRSVVGTLWAVDDAVVRGMVGAFYSGMVSEGGGMDCEGAARALNSAAKEVDKRQVPLEQRIVFIHIGV